LGASPSEHMMVSSDSSSFTMDSSRNRDHILVIFYLSENQQVAKYVWITAYSFETCQLIHIRAIHVTHHHRLFSACFLDLEGSFLECRPKEISQPAPSYNDTFTQK
jgi:hypothetical protein